MHYVTLEVYTKIKNWQVASLAGFEKPKFLGGSSVKKPVKSHQIEVRDLATSVYQRL